MNVHPGHIDPGAGDGLSAASASRSAGQKALPTVRPLPFARARPWRIDSALPRRARRGERLVVAVAPHAGLRREFVEVRELVYAQRYLGGGGVLLDPFQAPGAGNGRDPRMLGEQPRKGDLAGGGVLRAGQLDDVLDKGLVGGAVAGGEPGNGRGDVAGGELVAAVTVLVRKPLPSGLNGTNPMPSSAQAGVSWLGSAPRAGAFSGFQYLTVPLGTTAGVLGRARTATK